MVTAIVLAAGRGKRMGTKSPKQFLEYEGVPLIVKSLKAFEESPETDRIVLVTSEDYMEYCRKEICEKYHIRKVSAVIAGGAERYESVWNALLELEKCGGTDDHYVLIHDGARPFVTEEIIARLTQAAKEYGAAAAGMPSKDTVKIVDEEGVVVSTPPRNKVWIIQTPQAFRLSLLLDANRKLMEEGKMADVTDDAMIVERSGLARVRLVEGSYENIKITTPDDLKYLT